jgi:hypothetical protein
MELPGNSTLFEEVGGEDLSLVALLDPILETSCRASCPSSLSYFVIEPLFN